MDDDTYIQFQWKLLLKKYSLLTKQIEEEMLPEVINIDTEGERINSSFIKLFFCTFIEKSGDYPKSDSENPFELALFFFGREKHLFPRSRWWSRKELRERNLKKKMI